MKWSLEEWESSIEKLVNQCAEKVLEELEEVIMARLRENGEAVVAQGFLKSKPLSSAVNSVQYQVPQDNKDELLYAIGITKTLEKPISLFGMEDRPCHLIESGNLSMIVCPVSREEYSEESIHNHMEDMVWVESQARRHEEIILKTMEDRTVIPLPFCTIYRNVDNVKQQLTVNAEKIENDLNHLENHYEMQVKVLVNSQQLLVKLHNDLPYSGDQNGGGYFQKLQWEKKLKAEMEQMMNDYGESFYQDLNSISTESILLEKSEVAVQDNYLLVFAAHYLISKEHCQEWDTKLNAFDELTDSLGFMVEVSGPWPAYHFSRLNNEGEIAGG
ncbi:GvpL/GvpF family gas vesicle protein [Desulfosporosinus sp. FKB]|uniref:GvpL/GvpF family gas vesicle protein n=1 Tax=Desulfosporosinus sp. FKB TaxID=1969835 RepID=UPI000B49D787|nr:GvpL/GvpF family gas vesicle protein [Desulfosporosinus sp. FKB]